MKPRSCGATRLSMVGLALMGVVALTLPACGDGESIAGGGASPQPKKEEAPTAGPRCRDELGGFFEALDMLRRRLAVGLTYRMYVDDVRNVRVAYEDVPVDHLAIDCLIAVGTPSERSFNQYIDAANAWGECLSVVSCGSASVEPRLQRKWRVASDFLSTAHRGLRNMRARS